MHKYTISKTADEIHVFGNNQEFTNEDKNDLWNNHKILYLGGIMAVWIEERKLSNPLVHLMSEDDGHIFWYNKTDIRFDVAWLDNYIGTLTALKNRLAVKQEYYG